MAQGRLIGPPFYTFLNDMIINKNDISGTTNLFADNSKFLAILIQFKSL